MPSLTQIDTDRSVRMIKVLTQVDAGGTLRTLKQLWQNDANNVPRLIFISLAGTVSPISLTTTSGTTGICSCTPTGGTGPYTFAWSQISGDSGWSAVFPTNSSTQFSFTGAADPAMGAFACTVTDSTGLTAVSNSVAVHFHTV